MNINEITPVSFIKNEEYWIYYVLRDVLKVFGKAIVLDTGSTDKTLDVLHFLQKHYPGLNIISENFGNNAKKIGNSPNVLRRIVKTKWMFIVSGDEIWNEHRLNYLLSCEIPIETDVVLVGGHNVEDVNGKLYLRDGDNANYDRLFTENVTWRRTDHPYESYGLMEGQSYNTHYVDSNKAFFYHVRNTTRSSNNWDAFFRKEKENFFPWNGLYKELPDNWIESDLMPNPYLKNFESVLMLKKVKNE